MTLDLVILHTVMHHWSTSTYKPNFEKIEETFCGRTFETGFITLTRRNPLKNGYESLMACHRSLKICSP